MVVWLRIMVVHPCVSRVVLFFNGIFLFGVGFSVVSEGVCVVVCFFRGFCGFLDDFRNCCVFCMNSGRCGVLM